MPLLNLDDADIKSYREAIRRQRASCKRESQEVAVHPDHLEALLALWEHTKAQSEILYDLDREELEP